MRASSCRNWGTSGASAASRSYSFQRLAERCLRLRLAVGLVLQEGAQAHAASWPARDGTVGCVRVAPDQFLVQFHGVTMLDLRLGTTAGLVQEGPEVGVGPHLDLLGRGAPTIARVSSMALR